MSRIALVKTTDRAAGVRKALELAGLAPVKGKHLFLKPNLNSADAPPGSTHPDVLTTLIQILHERGAGRLVVGDRSGMGDTRAVMSRKEIFRMGDELGFETVVLDELDEEGWQEVHVDGSHWQRGFAIARPALQADGIVQTCCLKTHRYGGHFTLSLKNTVGLVAKQVPGDNYDYMHELHGSPHQRLMIAEANAAYRPDMIVLDGVTAFTEGGPAQGKQVDAGVILAGTDRVALDAVGVAILRYLGTTPEVSRGPVFGQEQIARAAELGLGIRTPAEIELLTDDRPSAEYAAAIWPILMQG